MPRGCAGVSRSRPTVLRGRRPRRPSVSGLSCAVDLSGISARSVLPRPRRNCVSAVPAPMGVGRASAFERPGRRHLVDRRPVALGRVRRSGRYRSGFVGKIARRLARRTEILRSVVRQVHGDGRSSRKREPAGKQHDSQLQHRSVPPTGFLPITGTARECELATLKPGIH